MKSVLFNKKPKEVARILNGEQSILISKVKPKLEVPYDAYLYCSMDKKYSYAVCEYQRGKVVAKFRVNKVEMVESETIICFNDGSYAIRYNLKIKDTCLSQQELSKILGEPIETYDDTKYGWKMKYKSYAWYIDNLVIFDKPKELSDFKRIIDYDLHEGLYREPIYESITKAPQSYCYCEVEEND